MAVKGALKEKTRTGVKEPRQYNVIMYNDDFTTMEFVVSVLTGIFHKEQADAERIMLAVHHKGKAVVGAYPYDLAKTRTAEAMRRAKEQGYPFRMTVEEA